MTTPNHTPTYNLRAVVQETGVKPDTLRAWERRYGLPHPERSAGGHRLYSRRDIETLKWLIARMEEGLSISRAVEFWHQLECQGEDPLDAFPPPAAKVTARAELASSLDQLRLDWIDACLQFDERSADATLAQAFAMVPIEIACQQILQRGLSDLGDQWFEGLITIQQEHFASGLAMRHLGALLTATPQPTKKDTLIVLCPSGEGHSTALLLFSLILRRAGNPVTFFGANTPMDQIETAIELIKPGLIIAVSQQLSTIPALLHMAARLSDTGVPIAFGGRIFNYIPELYQMIPGFFLGHDMDHALSNIEQILGSRLKPHPIIAASSEYRITSAHFIEKELQFKEQLAADRGIRELSPPLARFILDHFQDCIQSSLTLGDMSFLRYDLRWLDEFLQKRVDQPGTFSQFLEEYISALKRVMDHRGDLIWDWLSEEASFRREA